MGDPISTRKAALADTQHAMGKAQISKAVALAQLFGELATINLERDRTAKKAGATVTAADIAAKQAQAKQDAAAKDEAPPDITQFFPQVQVNPSNPTAGVMGGGGGIVPPNMLEMGAGGATGGALANRAVAGARQGAGTLPSAAPPQQSGGGGQPGMSVNVGGQQFSAPDELTTTRETTGPLQIGRGMFIPATSREVTTQPNVLTASDVMQAALQQSEAEKSRRVQFGEFLMSHELDSARTKATIAANIQTNTNAPAGVAMAASSALVAGNDQQWTDLMKGYDTTGAAGIAAKRAYAKYFVAQANKVTTAGGLDPMSLYQVAPFMGLGSVGKLPTGNAALATERSIRSGLAAIYGGTGLTAQISRNFGAGDASRASAIEAAGREAARLNSFLTFDRTSEDSDEYVIEFSNPGEIMGLYHLATGNAHGFDPAVKARAAQILANKGLGEVDDAGNLDPSKAAPVLQPWARKVQETYQAHRAAGDIQIDPKDPTKRMPFADALLDGAGAALEAKYPELFKPPAPVAKK